MRAVLFPGQGSQYVGMGSDFYQKYDEIKKYSLHLPARRIQQF